MGFTTLVYLRMAGVGLNGLIYVPPPKFRCSNSDCLCSPPLLRLQLQPVQPQKMAPPQFQRRVRQVEGQVVVVVTEGGGAVLFKEESPAACRSAESALS